MLWELAGRYATLHPDGVHLRLPGTHEMIAELAAARRPSASTALGRLARHDEVERRYGLWVLHGEPPSQHAHDRLTLITRLGEGLTREKTRALPLHAHRH